MTSLRANKMRSALTMLGIVIGVAAVVAMLSIGEGAKGSITRSIESMGTNLLFVTPGQLRVGMGGQGMGSNQTLKLEDCAAILEKCRTVVLAAPENSRQARVKAGNQNTMTQVVGTDHNYSAVRNAPVEKGAFISSADVRLQKKVAVIGATVAESLFGGAEPVGREFTINRIAFAVVGVLKKKGQSGFTNSDDMVIVPITTFQKNLFGVKYLRSISVQAATREDMDLTAEEISATLRKTHRLGGGADDFTVRNQTDMLEHMNTITDTLTLFLGGIAFISLLVGGIGIMNIMLVSVSERTREIGLRKALGARRPDILKQFLIEAVFLCVTGGVIGIALGWSISSTISAIGGWNTIVSAKAVGMSFVFSLAVGLFFGIYPAGKAAGLDAVVALRYE